MEDQYAISIKEDTAYPCLHSPINTEDEDQYVVLRENQYAVFKIWNQYNILEDIKCGPYFKKSPIRRIQHMDTPSVETEFPAIFFNDKLTSEEALSYEPTVSPLNDNEINFRISFEEFDDEDYTVIFDKNSFSYKIIFVNDLKTDSKNDNEKVNMPSFLSSEPTVSNFDDLDFFKDFENEFPAIVYNDALTSKSDSSTEPVEIPHHIDKFDLKTETLLSECDEEEQNVVYFIDLFPFNIIYPDDLRSDKDNDDNEIDIIQSSAGNVINTNNGAYAQRSNKLLETSHDTSNKIFKTKTFIKELNFSIMTSN
ncbi:hypothetical protein Tco_0961133 [Tanacetum coccineum]